MGLFKRSWRWATVTDTTLSLTDLVLRVLGISTGVGLVSGFLGQLAINPYAGLVIGLAAWIFAAVLLLVVRASRQQSAVLQAPTSTGDIGSVFDETPMSSQQLPQRAASASYPWATDDELRKPYIEHRSLYIFDLAHRMVKIRNKTFNDCQIYGPAVIAPLWGSWPFDDDCAWEEDAGNVVWCSTPGLDRKYTGVIGLENCSFQSCTFIRLGVLVDPPSYEHLTGLPAPQIPLAEKPNEESPVQDAANEEPGPPR